MGVVVCVCVCVCAGGGITFSLHQQRKQIPNLYVVKLLPSGKESAKSQLIE